MSTLLFKNERRGRWGKMGPEWVSEVEEYICLCRRWIRTRVKMKQVDVGQKYEAEDVHVDQSIGTKRRPHDGTDDHIHFCALYCRNR